MLPGISSLKQIRIVTKPSRDYQLEPDKEHMSGICEGADELRQAIFCILNTERYQYPLYSWNYGIELKDLYGKPRDYVMSELPRRITEALTQDDRIKSVDGFKFEEKGKAIHVSFTVHSVYGDVTAEKRWNDV